MKLNKLALAVAGAAMLATGVAEAKIEQTATATTFTGSELVLNVWNQTASQSYALDLGVFQYEIYADPTAARSWTLNDANFSSFLAGVATGNNVTYNVVSGSSSLSSSTSAIASGPLAGQQAKSTSIANYGLLTTLNSANTLVDFSTQLTTRTSINTAISGVSGMIVNVNGGSGESAGLVANEASMFAATSGSLGYAGTEFGTNIKNSLGNLNNSAALGEALSFVNAYTTTGTNNLYRQFSNVWKLNVANGVGTLSYGPAVAQVPVPAAAWMFLSGIMGLLASTRRKTAA